MLYTGRHIVANHKDTVTSSEAPAIDPPTSSKPPPSRYIRGVLTIVVLGTLLTWFLNGLITNDRMSWNVVAQYIFDAQIMTGLKMTIVLTVLSMAIATVLGVFIALMALSRDPLLRWLSRAYILVFRSVPPLVQLLFWYFLAAVLPTISIGIPFGPEFITFNSNVLISQFAAALLGLGLSEAAYLSEYFRAGILSVPRGQTEAALACGLTPVKRFTRVVAPQAIRIVIPAYGNSLISQIKGTSLVFAIGAGDLLTEAQLIYTQNYQQIPLLIVVSVWYLVLVLFMTAIQHRIEARFSRGYSTLSVAGNA